MFEIIAETSGQYDWVIISIGTAGDDEQQQCPNFARQLATEHRVVIYNIDPDYAEDRLPKDEHGIYVFRLNYPFPFHRRTSNCQVLSDQFSTLIDNLLQQNKKVVLMSCAIPILPDAFLMAAHQNNRFMESSQLFVIGSYIKDFLTAMYSPSFLAKWYENHMRNGTPLIENRPQEHVEFWATMTKSTDTYFSLGENEEQRNNRFQIIQQRFLSMGKIIKRLSLLQKNDLALDAKPKSPGLPTEQLFKKFRHKSNLAPFNASHAISKGTKSPDQSKSQRRNNKVHIFKGLQLLGTEPKLLSRDDLAFAFIEVIAGELFRFLIPATQPKTRFGYSEQSKEYGIMSTEIPKFVPIENALLRKSISAGNEFDQVKANINRIGLGKILIGCLWLGEFDLKLGNIGTNLNRSDQLYKIDHGCCLPATWRKYNTAPESSTNNKPIIDRLNISHETIEALPFPANFCAFNWLDLTAGGETINTRGFMDAAILQRVSQDLFFREEINTTILTIILLTNEEIRAFISTYKLQFLTIENEQYHHFIEEVAQDIIIELINRREQLKNAALKNERFIAFLYSEQGVKALEDYNQHLSTFTLFKKFKLPYSVKTLEKLKSEEQALSGEPVSHGASNTLPEGQPLTDELLSHGASNTQPLLGNPAPHSASNTSSKEQPLPLSQPTSCSVNRQIDINARIMGHHDFFPHLFNSKDELFQKIQAMHDYGVLLKEQGASKGQVAIDLASNLTDMANQFFSQQPEQHNFSEFKPRFSRLLHSKDQEMSTYRISWGTIVKNIAIALTGIGLLLIAAKLIWSKVTDGRALFFFQKNKTTSEEKIADIQEASSWLNVSQ